jgi:tetratricopeptide (TPR) repeat protein
MKKKMKRTNLFKQHSHIVDVIFVAIVGALFGAIFGYSINNFPKISQEFYKLFSYSITLNIVIILILIASFFVLIFRHTKKRTTLIVLFVIFFIVILEGFGIYRMCKIKDKSLVIIAKFEDFSKQKGVDIDGKIYEQLSNNKKSNSNFNSFIIERIPLVIKNEEEANKEGKSGIWRNAKIIIVIWGKNEDIGVKTCFNVVKAPKKEVIIKISIEEEISTMDELRNFSFSYYRETLPDLINSLFYFTFGLSRYFENNYTEAISYFNEFLNYYTDTEARSYSSKFLNEFSKGTSGLLDTVYFYVGNSYYFQNNLIQAEREYREAIRINPDNAEVHCNLGVLLHELYHYNEAEREYREAIRINPDYTEAHYNLGNLLDDLKRYEEAEKEFKKVIRIKPDDTEANYNLKLLLKMKKLQERKMKQNKKF